MSSVNKLSLKQFVKTQQPLKHRQNDNKFVQNLQTQEKSLKNDSRHKQGKKMKLHTLPCELIQNQKEQGEMFLFRSTWEDDMEHFKQQIKGCTSPTFATQILSSSNNYSALFNANDHPNEQEDDTSKRNRISNSRSKSKHNKSLQKFIGDNVSTHRPSNSTIEKRSLQPKQQESRQAKIQGSLMTKSNDQQKYLYEINKLQSMNYELKRENKKVEQKYLQLKQKCRNLQDQVGEKPQNNQKSSQSLMSNEELLQKMKNESFWKFYLKAQKMIRSSIMQNNQQSSSSPINFMKELQALREMTSTMKKENKSLKKISEDKEEEAESGRDKLSILEVEIQEMRIKCVAYESSIKKLREEIVKYQKDLQKLSEIKDLQAKLNLKSIQNTTLSKQLNTLNHQIQQQQLLNSQCEKQRISTKKKCQQLNDQVLSLNKQLSSLKTSYNLLQMQKQQLSANKKQLIQKQKLKEKVYQLEKELKSLGVAKQQEVTRLRSQYEGRFGKEIEGKESRVKELDEKVEKILNNLVELQSQNCKLSQDNEKLSKQLSQIKEYTSEIQEQLESLNQQQETTRHEKQTKLSQLSRELQTLTLKSNEQSSSLLTQQNLIQQLKKQVNQKEELLKLKQYESQQLKASLVMIKEEQSHAQSQSSQLQNNDNDNNKISELQEYISRLEQKHNQALELYENVHNEKVELQLQLQYYETQLDKIQDNQPTSSYPISKMAQQQTLQLIESLLTIKQEIIKKILIFCPGDYKQLLIQYIYYGDMIKEKYLQLIDLNSGEILQNNESQEQSDENEHQEDDESYLQQEGYQEDYKQNKTRRNDMSNRSVSMYNRTKPYQSKCHYQNDTSRCITESPNEQQQQTQSKQEQINQLLEQFIKIGKIIDEQTNPNYKKKYTQNPPKRTNKQKQQNYYQSKQKQIQQFKNLNKRIINIKENNINNNNENSFNYKLDNNKVGKRIPQRNIRKISQQKKQFNRREPLQQVSQKEQYNISRPLFVSSNVKINNPNMKKAFQEEMYNEKPQNQVSLRGKHNFNHGASNKLNFFKISGRIQH